MSRSFRATAVPSASRCAHAADGREPSAAVARLLREEEDGFAIRRRYARFAEDVQESKRALLELLIELRRDGKHVVGYGAPGKGNTLLNYCGIRTDFLEYTVDRNPYKHGRFTPGTHIPIHSPDRIAETRPDAILILPWNLVREISEQLAYTREWGAKLIVPIPPAGVRAGAFGAARHRGEGRDLLRRPGRAHGRADAAAPEADGEIGTSPILWHIMRYYAAWGHKDFILCLGQKGDVIKEYFLTYNGPDRTTSCSTERRKTNSSCSRATSGSGGSRSSTRV